MTKDSLIRSLGNQKLFEGRPEQITDWSAIFLVRRDIRGYYISWRGGGQVFGTETFDLWNDARRHLSEHWRRFVDEEFERQVLIGSEQSGTDNSTEDPSST